jgi:hypothetical protein
VSVPEPTATTRWRCTGCGNLTRFDVTRTTRAVEFVHLDLAGEPVVEERHTVSDVVEQVRCRWCDALDAVELVPRADASALTAGRTVEEAAVTEDRRAGGAVGGAP